MKNEPYIVLDIETTGLNSQQDEIIEICAMKLGDSLEIQEEFYSLIKIATPLPPLIVSLTGIHDSDLETKGRSKDAVLKEFKDFIKGAILVGHNIDDFDMKFIRKAFESIGEVPLNATYDTLRKSKEIFRFYRYRLEDMAGHLNIPAGQYHNARGDVKVTVELFKHLMKAEK